MKKVPDNVKTEAEILLRDIKSYLDGANTVPGSQNVISFKSLFRGYIVSDWFSCNKQETKYKEVNKIITKQYVNFY